MIELQKAGTGFINRHKFNLYPGLLLSLVLFLSACGGAVETSLEPRPVGGETQPSASNDSTEPVDQSPSLSADDISLLWQQGAHAATYVLDDASENSTCARCHSPVNWIPSMDDMPESCSACKFEIDPPPPVIAENEWTHIECKVCHQYKKDEVQPEITWLEIAAIDEYAEIESVTALCDKCHLAGEIASHASVVVSGDHTGYACTDCHDAHSTTASCGAVDCHPTTMDGSEGIAGHDPDHTLVSCSACHDASGMDIGPLEDTGAWVTFLPGGTVAFASHESQLAVECSRCHYTDNPWELSEAVVP